MSNRIEKASIEISDYAQSISKGGTSSMTVDSAAGKFGYLRNGALGVNGGVAKLNTQGKLPTTVMVGSPVGGSTVTIGPNTTAYGGVANVFTITNYDSFTSYVVSTTNGTVSVSGDKITYTPVNASGAGGFTVNGEMFNVTVIGQMPGTPSITSPVNGATNIGSKVVVSTGSFSMVSGSDTHAASDWQVSTSPTFATILYESINDTVNKTSWTSGALSVSTQYYIRVRHKGTTYGYSQWSSVVSMTTKNSFRFSEEIAFLAPSDLASGDRFGYSVSLSADGSTVAISSPQQRSSSGAIYQGSVYIFTRSGSTWTQQAKLTASDAAAEQFFGESISISADGQIVLAGNIGVDSQKGAVYIFTRSGSTWTQQQKITASDGAIGDRFGASVSLSADGSTALVGAYAKSSNTGAAYIFTRSGSTWSQQQKLTASDAAVSDFFGISVSLSSDGSTALVGAYYKSTQTGAAYVFTHSGSTWTQQQKITASDGAANDLFGWSVSLSADGSTALVGAHGKSTNTGAAYIFTRSGSTWTQQQKITASDGATGDTFGYSVSLSSDGSTALVGAPGKSSSAGVVYIFTRTGSTWSQQSKLAASDGGTNHNFGFSVKISSDGTVTLAGALGKVNAKGSAYFYA